MPATDFGNRDYRTPTMVGTDETPGDYRRLIDRLKRFPKCIKLQKSAWTIESAFDSYEVRDKIPGVHG